MWWQFVFNKIKNDPLILYQDVEFYTTIINRGPNKKASFPPQEREREFMCNLWISCQWSSFMHKYGNLKKYVNEPKVYTGIFDL